MKYSYFEDGLNLIRKITPGRFLNLVKLYASYYYIRYTGGFLHSGKPFTASIEPTTSCNLRCPECPSGLRQFTRPTGKMSLGLFQQTVDQLSPGLFYLILYFQGEPFLNPLFFKMVEYAKQKRIYTATSTNAHFLNDNFAEKTVRSDLDRIIISLDGTDQDTYEKYRVGGKLDKVIKGIENLIKWKRELKSATPYVVMQFIVFRTNEHQVEDVKALAKLTGVDKLELKSAQVYDYEEAKDLIPENEKYSRYKKDSSGNYIIDNSLNNHCFRMWRGSVITWDGLVVPCCFDKDATHRLGDLKKQSFEEIWNSETYRNFRKKVFSERAGIDICRNCTEK